jgi:FdhD protein
VLASVSAASTLAVELAGQLGLTLCSFVREGRGNVHTHRERLDLR